MVTSPSKRKLCVWLLISVEHDPVTGFCDSESDRIGLDFENISTGSDMDIQTALITAVEY